jgi:hypothetical protein
VGAQPDVNPKPAASKSVMSRRTRLQYPRPMRREPVFLGLNPENRSGGPSAVQSPGMSDQPEVWLRGPVPEIPAALQPVAHALLQAREDVTAIGATMPAAILWRRAGAASPGFHLLHLSGVIDRLFTYARGEALTDSQKTAARAETQDHPDLDAPALVDVVSTAIDRALDQLRGTNPSALFDDRRVGRTASSNVLGILMHAAEHTTRHVGQLITTVKILGNEDK